MTTAKWIGIGILFTAVESLLATWLAYGQQEWFVNLIKFAPNQLLAFVAIVIAAPFQEEIIFRGFLWRGLEESKLGQNGTLITTAVIFASLHAIDTPDIMILSILFIVGLLLGISYQKTRSIWVPVAIHATNNLYAYLAVYFQLL